MLDRINKEQSLSTHKNLLTTLADPPLSLARPEVRGGGGSDCVNIDISGVVVDFAIGSLTNELVVNH